jgi:hypothetical protein
MKTKKLRPILTIIATAFIAFACQNEDNLKPVIANLEVGHNDSIFAGEGIHLEFEVSDDELLDYYQIKIHSEEDHKSANTEVHWELDTIFTEISGLKNYTVHHHNIIVPADAEHGDYHFHLSVVDKSGNLAEEERDLILTESDEEHDDH